MEMSRMLSCSVVQSSLKLDCSSGGHKSAKLIPPDCCHVVQRVKAWDGCGRARSLNPQTRILFPDQSPDRQQIPGTYPVDETAIAFQGPVTRRKQIDQTCCMAPGWRGHPHQDVAFGVHQPFLT